MSEIRNPKPRGSDVERWLQEEIEEQEGRYRAIEQAMNVELAPQREIWVGEFLGRIQTRGTNVHYDQLRVVKPNEVPRKPNRPFKVVF
jgi:hypothetical protein